MEKKEEERKKDVTSEESESDYYTRTEGNVESSEEISPQMNVENKSVISPPPSPSIKVETTVNVKEPKARLRKAEIKTLVFPIPPVVNVSDLDTSNYLATSVTPQKHKAIITPLYFPIPPSVIVSQLDLEDYLTTSVSKKTKQLIQPLQFQTPPQIIVNPLDTEVYLVVKEKFASKLTPSEEITAQSTLQASVSSPLPKKDISIKSSVYDNFLSSFSSLLKASGVNIIVYDELKPGIEESLTSLGTELALINGYEVIPHEISTKNLNSIPLLGNAGVFKVDKTLCGTKDDKLVSHDQIENLLTKIMGYKFSILIIPSCFYIQYLSFIGGKPNRIFVDEDILKSHPNLNPNSVYTYKVNKNVIQKLAFGASGLQINSPSYNALANFKKSFTEILDNAQNWITLNYPTLDKKSPSSGSDEGCEHRKMKAVVIKHLIENLGVNPKSIRVEEQSCNEKIPDIYFYDKNGKRIAVDVKASRSNMPRDEVDEAYNKYQGCSDEVWVVLRPLPALLDLAGIVGRYKEYDKLRIFIPVMCDGNRVSLLPLEDFIQKMENLQTC